MWHIIVQLSNNNHIKQNIHSYTFSKYFFTLCLFRFYLCTYFCCQTPIYPKAWFLSFHISIPKLCTQYISRIHYSKIMNRPCSLPYQSNIHWFSDCLVHHCQIILPFPVHNSITCFKYRNPSIPSLGTSSSISSNNSSSKLHSLI